MKVVFLERASFGMDVDISCVEQLGEVTVYNNTDYTRLPEAIGDADIVMCNKAPLTGAVLAQCPGVKMIAEMATGYDNIDIAYCKEHGIAVANAGHYSTESVAQHTFALALTLLNKMRYYDDVVKDGTYTRCGQFSIFDNTVVELTGKTWGIIGLGAIGRQVGRIAEAFGCRVVTWSASGSTAPCEFTRVSWEEFVTQSDVISLHCPLTEKTRHLFSAREFGQMKRDAILLNLARGPVVDTAALAEALEAGEIAGAGLDVLEKEPMAADDALNRIQDSSRLVITPHMGWASLRARTNDVQITCENIKSFLEGGNNNRIV